MSEQKTREELLRNTILQKYGSLRSFSSEAEIPYTTLTTLLARSIGGASFDTVIQICRVLQLDPFSI